VAKSLQQLVFLLLFLPALSWADLPLKSDYHRLISELSPVKDQGRRSVCTTFSVAAHLEHILMKSRGLTSLDLSEQWLQILNTTQNSGEESIATKTLLRAQLNGVLMESELPYSPRFWEESDVLAKSVCGSIENPYSKQQCLWGHFDVTRFREPDPKLEMMLKLSKNHFPEILNGQAGLLSFDEAKQALSRGETVILDIDFYYGAWNHPEANLLGIPRSPRLWRKGIVGFPEEGTMDDLSLRRASGHSVLLVGYDDTKKVYVTHTTRNGRRFRKSYQGAFIFRNSLGTNRFGSHFEIDGKKYPGYGLITQEYVREYGSFVQFKLNP
jgi:hypothetical protein